MRAALQRVAALPRRSFVRKLSTHKARQHVEAWLSSFGGAMQEAGGGTAQLFHEDGFWRDHVAFTWNIRTFEGADEISRAFAATAGTASARNWRISETDEVVTSQDGGAEAWLNIETAAGIGKAHVRLGPDGRAKTLLTTLQELHGHPFAVGRNRALGAQHGVYPQRQYWHDKRAAATAALGTDEQRQPYVLIIGGGQAGLALGARLSLLGVPYLIIERHATAGASWRGRYPSLCLHDPVWYVACPLTAPHHPVLMWSYLPYMAGTITCPTCPSRRAGRCSHRVIRWQASWSRMQS